MIPTMVARKIAKSCHAFFVTPAGVGTNQSITPVAMDAIKGFIAAPCHGCLAAGVIEDPPVVAAALTFKPRFRRGANSRADSASLGKAMRGLRVLLKPRAAVLSGLGRVRASSLGLGFSNSDFGKEVRDLRERRVGDGAAVRASDAIGEGWDLLRRSSELSEKQQQHVLCD